MSLRTDGEQTESGIGTVRAVPDALPPVPVRTEVSTMRKLVITLAGLSLALVTAACGADAAEPAPTTAPSAPPATESSVAPGPPTGPTGGGGGGATAHPRP